MPLRPVGIRCKLIIIFIFIKVLPLIALAWIAWTAINALGVALQSKVADLTDETQVVIGEVSDLAVENSIRALDIKSRENIERLTTDTARAVARFLYDRDNDIRRAAELQPDELAYQRFLEPLQRVVTGHIPWHLNQAGDAWVPSSLPPHHPLVVAGNPDNAKDFHYRPPEDTGIPEERPLFLEMTFVDLTGREQVKVNTSGLLSLEKKDISRIENTYCKAEDYFPELQKLAPGEIYVSDVIGPYVPSPVIGAYTEKRARELGVDFKPEDAAYAGKENPVGRRFQGLVRWATPVTSQGRVIGWVTLALDHTHIMEFTDHIVPTKERYSAISDAGAGNYAFMWDYRDRNISHPRDFFIVGYDPETGQPAVPWLEQGMYENYVKSRLDIRDWERGATIFLDQSLKKSPAGELTRKGQLGLDCRYLNFAPQCEGWYNLTQSGGSGSFVIFWSGLWKLTTAAAIPYHTGKYSGARGFGFVTIGANVHEFHKAAETTGAKISGMAARFIQNLAVQNHEAQKNLEVSLNQTTREISLSTGIMIVMVILIAIWMADTLTRKITNMTKGIRLFQNGEMTHRLQVDSKDEIGMLAETFNSMAGDIQKLVGDLRQAQEKYQSFFENAPEGLYRTTTDGKFLAINAACAQMFGYETPEDVLATVSNIGEQLYKSPQRRQEVLSLLMEQGSVEAFEYEARLPDGSIRFMRTSCHLITEPDGGKYIEGIITDVTDRNLAIKALREAKDKAEQLSAMKSNFLSMVSHELRTPLTAIIGFAKMSRKYMDKLDGCLRSDKGEDKYMQRVKDNSDVIITEGERLTELINNVLDLTKLEAGHFEWSIKDILLQSVLYHSIAATLILFDRQGIELVQDVDETLPTIRGDYDRLVQVCINLLANAVKFTEKGRVVCSVRQKGQEFVVRISDTGCGVPPEEAEAIFDKFRQLGDTLTGKPKGTGLGLPICKEIVEFHGGRIWCESRPGGGSVFVFSLPLEHEFPESDL